MTSFVIIDFPLGYREVLRQIRAKAIELLRNTHGLKAVVTASFSDETRVSNTSVFKLRIALLEFRNWNLFRI